MTKKTSTEFEKCLRHDSRELLRTIFSRLFNESQFSCQAKRTALFKPNKDGIDNLIFLPCPKHTLGRSTLTKDWRWEEFLKKNTGRILRNSEKWWLLYRYLRRYCWKNFIYLLQVLGELSDHESLMFLYSSLLRSFLLPKAPLDFFFSMSELLQVQKS